MALPTIAIQIDAWSLHTSGDGYTAPELRAYQLRGIVKGHPEKRDGTCVYTSAILRVNGRYVFTESGSMYELGEPHPEYVAWCKAEGKSIDPEHPIKLIGGDA